MTNRRISKGREANNRLTTVEVLVVVVVVAFLLSILVPALGRVKTHAQDEVRCRANLRQVGIVVQMFLQENDFTMPDCHVISTSNQSNRHLWTTDGRESSPRRGPDDDSYWGTAYNEYVKDIKIFRCPAMAEYAENLASDLIYGYPDGVEVIKNASFGLNGYTDQLNTNSVRNQAETIICTDHVEPRNEQAHQVNRGDMLCMGVDIRNLSHYRPDLNGNPTHPRQLHYRGIFRHNVRSDEYFQTGGRASVLWLDGRATTIEETNGRNVPNRWYDPRGDWLNIQ